MAKYLLAYRGGGMPETPEAGAKVMAAWGAWFGQLGAAVADPGNPVGKAKTIAADGSVATLTVTGPVPAALLLPRPSAAVPVIVVPPV